MGLLEEKVERTTLEELDLLYDNLISDKHFLKRESQDSVAAGSASAATGKDDSLLCEIDELLYELNNFQEAQIRDTVPPENSCTDQEERLKRLTCRIKSISRYVRKIKDQKNVNNGRELEQNGQLGSQQQKEHPESSEQNGNSENPEQNRNPESRKQFGSPDSPGQNENPGSPEQNGNPESLSQNGNSENAEQNRNPESRKQIGNPDSPGQNENPGSPEQNENPESLSQNGNSDSPEKNEHLENPEQIEQTKNPDDSLLNVKPMPSLRQILADNVQSRATLLGAVSAESCLNMYALPMTLKYYDKVKRVRRFISTGANSPQKGRDTKTVIMVGISGSGKSLMINNLINYIYGVDYDSVFRFKLILEDQEKNEREQHGTTAMTSWVTSYDLIWQEGFPMDFNLTLIDTPGFADDKGVDYDEIIVERIKSMFSNKSALPNQKLDAIGFVIPASTTRLTAEQKYVFDQVLNIFGKDLAQNVTVLCTFADAQLPPAIETIRRDGIPIASFFKFNNSAVFAPNDDENREETEYAWKFGHKNVTKFLEALKNLETQKLDTTNAVLDERESLKLLLLNLQPQIDIGMNRLQDIEKMIDEIFTLNGTMQQNKKYEVTKTVYKQYTEVVQHGITNCPVCMETCHTPCYISGDVKKDCWAMSNGNCRICKGKCTWDVHKNGDRVYTYKPVEEVETIKDMLDRYNISIIDKKAKQKLLENILKEYRIHKLKLLEDIVEAAEASRRLDKLALRNNYLTNVDYIERLIETERANSRAHKQKRIEQLQVMLGMAKTLQSAKNNPKSLTQHMSNYEMTVKKRIEQLNNQMEDGAPISDGDTFGVTMKDINKRLRSIQSTRYLPVHYVQMTMQYLWVIIAFNVVVIFHFISKCFRKMKLK